MSSQRLSIIIFLTSLLLGAGILWGAVAYRQQQEEKAKIGPVEEPKAKAPAIYETTLYGGTVEFCKLEVSFRRPLINYDPATACLRTVYLLKNKTGSPMKVTYNWFTCFCPDLPFGQPPYHDRCFQNCLVFNEYPADFAPLGAGLFNPLHPQRTLTIPPGDSLPLPVERCTGQDCGSFQFDLQVYAVNDKTDCQDFAPLVYLTERTCPIGTPTPTPVSSFQCTGLGPQPIAPQPGQSLTFTCRATASNVEINHYNFRVLNEEDNVIAGRGRVETSTLEADYPFIVPAGGGRFTVQCQVCASNDDSRCTTWGEAN